LITTGGASELKIRAEVSLIKGPSFIGINKELTREKNHQEKWEI